MGDSRSKDYNQVLQRHSTVVLTVVSFLFFLFMSARMIKKQFPFILYFSFSNIFIQTLLCLNYFSFMDSFLFFRSMVCVRKVKRMSPRVSSRNSLFLWLPPTTSAPPAAVDAWINKCLGDDPLPQEVLESVQNTSWVWIHLHWSAWEQHWSTILEPFLVSVFRNDPMIVDLVWLLIMVYFREVKHRYPHCVDDIRTVSKRMAEAFCHHRRSLM